MTSTIDETKPVHGTPTTLSVRDNFAVAKSEITALQTAIAAAAPLASPALTGNPTAPTPATADSDTSIATTAYVQAQGYATTTSVTTADNLRVLKAGDTMTGSLLISTASGWTSVGVRSVTGMRNQLLGFIGPNLRWEIDLGDGSAESTGNAGSNFGIARYNDAGGGIDYALTLNRATGNAVFTGTVTAAGSLLTSDAELKTDIEPLGEALPLVARVEPKSFRWRDGDDTRHSGFLAQDLAEIEVPGIVDGKPGDGLAADVGAMLAVLWQAVRELSAEVAELKAGTPSK